MGRVIEFSKNRRHIAMYIGDIMKERMQSLGISISALASDTFLEEEYISDVINNKISYDCIDEIDLEFISSALYCTPVYFIDESVRHRDIIRASLNRGICDPDTNKVKGKLQQFANDFIFLRNIYNELKGEI